MATARPVQRPAVRRPGSSTTPAASGSSPTPAGARRPGSCRWPSPASRSLGHRGAFAADGASSDGAGVAIPLEPDVLRPARPGAWPAARGSSRSSPRERPRGEAATRALVERALVDERLPAPAWRVVPSDPAVLGREAAASRPAFLQAIVERPAGLSDTRFERRLVLARRRMETAARARARSSPGSPSRRPRRGRSSTRASSPATGWPGSTPTSAPGLAVSHARLPPALRDEHDPRLAAGPALPFARPQRRDQHGPREPRAGPGPGRRSGRAARIARGPAARGRSAPLAGRLRLAVARRGARAPRPDRVEPRRGAPRARPRGAGDARGRAPARRGVRPAGRPGSSRRGTVRPRSSSRTAAGSARSSTATGCDRWPSRSPPTGSWRPRPRRAPSRSTPARWSGAAGSGPGELLLVDPGRGAILEDVEAKTDVLRRSWRPDAPRPVAPRPDRARRDGGRGRRRRPRRRCASWPASTPSGPGSTSGR